MIFVHIRVSIVNEIKYALHVIALDPLEIDDQVGLKSYLENKLEEGATTEQELVCLDQDPVLAQESHVVKVLVISELLHQIYQIVTEIIPVEMQLIILRHCSKNN